jgi:hypothetical protein
MTFSISLSCPPTPSGVEIARGSQGSAEDYEQMVMDACEILAVADCRFRIEGFGSSEWTVDVGYDLSAFMEQFPELLVGVRERRSVEVDLYSQGVERTLEFNSEGDLVEIRCVSRTDWVPDPDVEFVTRKDLEAMLSKLAVDFSVALRDVGSSFAQVAPFVNWQVGKV